MVTIVYTDKKIAGFWGMNYRAAWALGIKKYFPYFDNTIAIWNNTNSGKRKWLIEHETLELNLMKKGLSYREAHARTLVKMGDYATLDAARRDADRMIQQAKEWKRKYDK